MKQACCAGASFLCGALLSMLAVSSTETAVANGDTRTLNLYHTHTGESIQATFRVNGSYDPAVLDKLNWFLRDWRNNDRARMDPRLFDVVWEVYRTAGVNEPIRIVSAYRSPETNAMLRRRSSAVAEHSQHILGKAMDTTITGMSMERIREVGMRLQRGGVGYYGSAAFVHLDVGNVRSWPRMSYDQLARLFPDGKTVHLASNGRPLPRYEEARLEIASRGGLTSDAPTPSSGNLFSWLFGRGREDEDEAAGARIGPARPERPQVAALDRPARSQSAGVDRPARTQVAGLDRFKGRAPAPEQAPPPPAPQPSPSPSLFSFAAPQPAPLQPTPTPPEALPAQTPAPAPIAVASLAPSALAPERRGEQQKRGAAEEDRDAASGAPKDSRDLYAAGAPLPPRRPADLVPVLSASASSASAPVSPAFAAAPLPPPRADGRSDGLVRIAAVAPQERAEAQRAPARAAVAAPANPNLNASLDRAASLPVVITEGPKDRAGGPQALAYAEGARPAQGADSTGAAKAASPSRQPAIVSARLDKANFSGLASQTPLAGARVQAIPGQPATGLRQAARIMPDALSARPSAGYATAFGASASDLDCSHFRPRNAAAFN